MKRLKLLEGLFLASLFVIGAGCSSSKDSAGESSSPVSSVSSTTNGGAANNRSADSLNVRDANLADRNAPEERDQLTSSLRGPRELDQRDITNVSRQSVAQSLEQLGSMLQNGVFTCEEFQEKLNVANRHCVAGENHRVLNESLLTKCHNLQKSYNSYMMFCY